MTAVTFRTIDIERDFSACLQCRRWSWLASFGTDDGFDPCYGPNSDYRNRLQQKVSVWPELNVHLWQHNLLIGQVEAKVIQDLKLGYINLLVLRPEYRRRGLGQQMLAYVQDGFRRYGLAQMQLSVSRENMPALRFYHHTDWVTLGPRADKPQMLLLQKDIG